ncbi:MAG: hypothetical protein HZA95_00140 [Candidatus Vogelbacteria bacterium]|nr:hypothetical protein [Candidatus Vogelbacteria bacterium]
MKLSKVMHIVSILLSVFGAVLLVGAWIAGASGTFIGLSQAHLYNDAIAIELIAIAASVCVLARMQMEKDNPGKLNII